MKILIVNPNLIMGGAQKILLNLALQLERLGHHVTVFTTPVEREGLSPAFRDLRVVCSRHPILTPGGTTTRYQNVHPLRLLLSLLSMRHEVAALIRRERINVVLAHQPPAPWLCSFFGIPVVWNCFEPIALWQSRRPEYFSLRPDASGVLPRLLEEIYEWCDRLIVRHGVPHIFVLSQRLQRQIQVLYGKPSEVIYIGSEPALESDQGAGALSGIDLAGAFVILQVGQFHVEKNHLLTLEAVKRLKTAGGISPIKLLLVGEGGLRPRIEAQITADGLDDIVHVLGSFPLDDPRLHAVYRRSHVLVFPSVRQSWGLAPFEALAHGVVPVVSTDCGASEVIQAHDIGYVADPSPEAFVAALMRVFRHPEEAREKAARGRRVILEQFTYEHYAKRVADRLHDICRNHAEGLRSSLQLMPAPDANEGVMAP